MKIDARDPDVLERNENKLLDKLDTVDQKLSHFRKNSSKKCDTTVIHIHSYSSYGTHLHHKQVDVDPSERDYGYIEYFRKAMDDPEPGRKEMMFTKVKYHEGQRDFYAPCLKQINHLIHIDQKPNLDITEAKWELYKVSISFERISKS